MNQKIDIYVRVLVPTWLEAAGYKTEAEIIRQLPSYSEESCKDFNRTMNGVRTTLRKKRHDAKWVARRAAWNAWPVYDLAWTVARGVTWTPTIELIHSYREELTKYQKESLYTAGHTARAAAWSLAWDKAVDHAGDDLDGKAIWNMLYPIKVQIDERMKS